MFNKELRQDRRMIAECTYMALGSKMCHRFYDMNITSHHSIYFGMCDDSWKNIYAYILHTVQKMDMEFV